MSRSPKLGAVSYATESSFGENTSTFGTRLSTLGVVSLAGFKQAKIAPDRTTGYRNQKTAGINGVKRCEFKTKFWLPGHGSTCAGTITLTDLETLLGIALGRGSSDVAAASTGGGTTATAGGTTTSLNVSQVNGGLAGAIFRAGTLGDARGGGQPFVISGHATSVMTSITAIPAALNNGDVVYAPVNINTAEAPSTNTIQPTRWLLQTANQQIEAHGCYPKGWVIEAKNGLPPTIEITWGGAWWDYSTATFPPAGTFQTHSPVPVAAGSFFFQVVGTTTRALLSVRDFKLTYSMNVVEQTGPGGIKTVQDIVGCVRVRDDVKVSFTLDAEAAASTPTLAGYWDGNANYHLLYALSSADSSAVILYLPSLFPSDDRPTQEDLEGLNRVTLMLEASTGGTTTTELTSSILRVALG